MIQFPEVPADARARGRMLNVVRSEVGHEPFTANCLLDLLDDIDRAAQRMVEESRLEEDDFAEAEDGLRELLSTMAASRADLGYFEFREDTLHDAKIRFCPRWPICR